VISPVPDVGIRPSMTFDLTPTAAQHDLVKRTHEFAET
jgi:hypothetical protein